MSGPLLVSTHSQGQRCEFRLMCGTLKKQQSWSLVSYFDKRSLPDSALQSARRRDLWQQDYMGWCQCAESSNYPATPPYAAPFIAIPVTFLSQPASYGEKKKRKTFWTSAPSLHLSFSLRLSLHAPLPSKVPERPGNKWGVWCELFIISWRDKLAPLREQAL